MYKHLPKIFQTELALSAICRQTLILLLGIYLGLMLWQSITTLKIDRTIYSLLQGLPLEMGIGIIMGIAAILLLLLFIGEIIHNTTHFISLFSPIIAGQYPLSYHFNWQALSLYVIILCITAAGSLTLALVFVLFLNFVTWKILFKNRRTRKQLPLELQKKNEKKKDENPLKDIPILNLNEDSLGREDFVKTFYRIIDNSHNNRNVILLNASWGQGKTSVLNCVESYAEEKMGNQLIFRWVNPWQK